MKTLLNKLISLVKLLLESDVDEDEIIYSYDELVYENND